MTKLAALWFLLEYGWENKWYILGGIAVIWFFIKVNREGKKQGIEDEAKKQGGFKKLSAKGEIIINNSNTKNLSDIVKETVLIKTVDGHGSGFVADSEDGWIIVTNNHVVSDNEYVLITHHDGKEEYGHIVRKDESIDLAVISFPNKHGRKGSKIASKSPAVGDEVFAIGSPLDENYSNSVSKGIISSTNRVINEKIYIQSDVTINPGNSGGPLVLKTSEVVGVAVSGLSSSEGETNLGINHFIPVSELKKSLNIKVKDIHKYD